MSQTNLTPLNKYKVGDTAWYIDEIVTILQRRIENGHLCYRIDSGKIVHENHLK